MIEIKSKPCPFCGSENVRFDGDKHAVVCMRCKARGCIAPNEDMARDMWNDRLPEPNPAQRMVHVGCVDVFPGVEASKEQALKVLEEAAEGFEPDAYMKLPLDADGVPIRIGDKVNVDGDAMTVLGYRLHNGTLLLIVKESGSIITYSPKPSSVRHFKYVPPDSWEKLEEDASVGAQYYCANRLGIDIRKTLTSDDDSAFAKDIIRRAKKLAGIDEEAQR